MPNLEPDFFFLAGRGSLDRRPHSHTHYGRRFMKMMMIADDDQREMSPGTLENTRKLLIIEVKREKNLITPRGCIYGDTLFPS
jgi:hypothetical protein